MSTALIAIDDAIASLGLTMEAKFVPFSQSRNKAEKHKTLNWLVTIKRNGRDVLTTDYSAGIAHAPSHALPAKHADRSSMIAQECETGFAWRAMGFGPCIQRSKPILPSMRDVMHSLIMDSSVINSSGFSDWCSELGYDDDSIKAKQIFDACMEIALKLRAAIGEAGFEKLQAEFSDY